MQIFRFHPKFIFRSPLNSYHNKKHDSILNEAIYLSSPTFYAEYQKHLINPITDVKELKKLDISLYKYQTRSRQRCTPFGLFAGISVGEWKNQNNIILDSDLKNALYRKTRLDMNVLCSLTQELINLPFIKPFLKFYPNTSIYLIGNSYRYVEYYYVNNRRFHKVNKVDFSEYLQNILSVSKIGLTQCQLSSILTNYEISQDEADDFINELISSQILVNQLEPSVTGIDYFSVLQENLKSINTINYSEKLSQLITDFNEIELLIKNIDDSIFNQIESYQYIHEKLKTILPNLNETNLVQTDLYKKSFSNESASSGTLGMSLQLQLQNTLQFLNKITPVIHNKNLDNFKKRFFERYEDNEIPLLVALDLETGVGYPSNDINGINELIEDVFAIDNIPIDININWNAIQTHLLKLINYSIKHNKKIIEISEADFKDIDYSNENLPSTFPVMFKVLNSITNKIDLSNVGGSSAVNLLGRFAGGNRILEDITRQLTEFEQKQMPGKILAEIVHLPESRTGNILARPDFRPYEIPYLAKASVEDHFQIKMEDLMLKIKGDKIILFDTRLQKEIIPRLGNAHNFSVNSLPVYHFLCDIQTQYFSKPYLGFNWGVLSNQFSFLPRVEFQNSVLSSAKWQLNKVDLEPLQDIKKTIQEKQKLFFELKNRIELPDKFLIADGDNELLINSIDSISIETFIGTIKNRSSITLEEYLFEEEYPLIKDTNGNSFTNECIAILLNENKTEVPNNFSDFKSYKSKQEFTIGSKWLYYKIYCGSKMADHILTEKIKFITETLLNDGAIDKWFFIRYADPDMHLRFRLHISNFQKYGEILQLINKELEPLLTQHVISKIQTDTYKREIARYGDNSISLVENLFYTDSVFVTDMLSMLDSEGGTIRWKMAIRSVDEFLNDFKLTNEEKFNLISALSNSFFKEHGGKKELKLTLDAKFRTLRTQIEDIFNYSNEEKKEYYPILELINNRSRLNKQTVDNILRLNSNNQLELNMSDLLASLLHMNLDRIFMGRNRTNEFVVYDLLFRYYKSNIARLKSNSKSRIL